MVEGNLLHMEWPQGKSVVAEVWRYMVIEVPEEKEWGSWLDPNCRQFPLYLKSTGKSLEASHLVRWLLTWLVNIPLA